jgi:hypothetical protein
MWIRLPAWMMVDEEPSLPAPGDLLAGIGIRAYGTPAAAPSGAADGIEEVLAIGVRPQDAEYVLTGTVSNIRDYDAGQGAAPEHAGAECVLDTGTGRFHVQYTGWARDVDPGSRAQLRSKLTAIGGYEWEAFGLTDTRTDWTVHDVAVLNDGDAMVRVTAVP